MTYPYTCGFCPSVEFHLPRGILKDTFVLDSEPNNSNVNNCRGFVRGLTVINVETDCYLLSLDHLIGHARSYRLILFHKLLIVQ
jgi:hypothetical protein